MFTITLLILPKGYGTLSIYVITIKEHGFRKLKFELHCLGFVSAQESNDHDFIFCCPLSMEWCQIYLFAKQTKKQFASLDVFN